MNTFTMKTVITQVLSDISQNLQFQGKSLNERYIHHYFSHIIQKHLPIQISTKPITELHSEWPTYKSQTNLLLSKYKKINHLYQPSNDGSAGFIDFAMGNYSSPEIGVEFSLKYGWSDEEVTFDFLKLLDAYLPFVSVFSLNLLLRTNRVSNGNSQKRLIAKMNHAFQEATNRLNKQFCSSREHLFIIAEIDVSGNRNIWTKSLHSQCFVP